MVSDSRTIKKVAFSGARNPRVEHRHSYRPLEIIKTEVLPSVLSWKGETKNIILQSFILIRLYFSSISLFDSNEKDIGNFHV